MSLLQIFCLILVLTFAVMGFAQDDYYEEGPGPEDIEVMVEDDGPAEEIDEPDVRTPPAPNRFRAPPTRFGNRGRSSGRSGGGTDRLGKTQGEVKFELVEPPKYYLKKNQPFLKPPPGYKE